jgi:5,10-methylenetetrahydromethanopterin reductase
MTPALGVLLYSDYTLAELTELGRLSEELGYRFFWYTDVRFTRECYLGLAAVAAKTACIRLGTGVTDPYSRHPAITAATIATLDELCGGRAVLGLGTGGAGFREIGLERKLPVAAMRETVDAVRRLVRGEDVTSQGKVISIAGGRLNFKPVRDNIPIYFATHGARIARLAGQIADGVLIANTLNPAAFAFYLGQLDDGMTKAGRGASSLDIGLRVEACIADNDEAAFAVMRKRVASRVLTQYPHWEYLDEIGIKLPEEFVALASAKEKPAGHAERATQLLPARVVESMVLAGNAERCAQQLACGLNPRITQISVRPHAIAGQSVAAVIRAFAEHVVPRALEIAKRPART